MVESALEEAELTDVTTDLLGKPERQGGYIRYGKNVFTVNRNLGRNEARVLERYDNSWLYYRYEVSVFPVEEVTLEFQKKAATAILGAFAKHSSAVELVAGFEL